MTTPDNVCSVHAGLFARDGHLTMLTLDRFEVGELSTAATEEVIGHVESCECCADRLGEMRGDVVELVPPVARRQNAWTGVLAIAGVVAAAAALLTVAWPQPQQAERTLGEQSRLSASPYTTTAELEGAVSFAPAVDLRAVLSDDGRALHDGDPVATDARVRIEVSPHEAGFLAVVSATQNDDVSADGDTDGSAAMTAIDVLMPVTRLAAHSGPHAMVIEPEAVGLPSSGEALERVVAIYCADAFALELDGRFDPDLPDLEDGCTSVEISLERVSEVADS